MKNLTTEEHIYEFTKKHYLRPDNDDRGWEEYKTEEEENMRHTLNKFPKNFNILNIDYSYHPTSLEFKAIIHTDIPTSGENEELLKPFIIELRGEAGNQIEITGIDYITLIYSETY